MNYRNAFMSLIELSINNLTHTHPQYNATYAQALAGDPIYPDSGAHRVRVQAHYIDRMCIIEQFGLDSVMVFSYENHEGRMKDAEQQVGKKVDLSASMHCKITLHRGLLNNDDLLLVGLQNLALNIAHHINSGAPLASSIYPAQ